MSSTGRAAPPAEAMASSTRSPLSARGARPGLRTSPSTTTLLEALAVMATVTWGEPTRPESARRMASAAWGAVRPDTRTFPAKGTPTAPERSTTAAGRVWPPPCTRPSVPREPNRAPDGS